MKTDARKHRWLRRLLFASITLEILMLLMTFSMFGLINHYLKNSQNYISYLLGLLVSSYPGSRIFPNPIGMAPSRKSLLMEENEVELYLKVHWHKLPRIYFTIVCFLFGLLSSFIFLLPGENPPQMPFRTFWMGVVVGIPLCFCISSLFMLWRLRKSEQ